MDIYTIVIVFHLEDKTPCCTEEKLVNGTMGSNCGETIRKKLLEEEAELKELNPQPSCKVPVRDRKPTSPLRSVGEVPSM